MTDSLRDMATDLTDDELGRLRLAYARMHASCLTNSQTRLAGWYWTLTVAVADELDRRGTETHALTLAAGEVGGLASEDDEDLSGWLPDVMPPRDDERGVA